MPNANQFNKTAIIVAIISTLGTIVVAVVSGNKVTSDARDASNQLVEIQSHLEAIKNELPADVPVGTIVATLLSKGDFYKTLPPAEQMKWVLADGKQVIANTKYFELTGESKIPNLQGYFLRGLDATGAIDPDGRNRTPGHRQFDSFQGHHHLVDTKFSTEIAMSKGQTAPLFYNGDETNGNPNALSASVRGPIADNKNHGTPRISSETRPKNIAVNYFIKVN